MTTFNSICEKYQTWIVRVTSSLLLKPVFLIWLTDSRDRHNDKLVLTRNKKIVAAEDSQALLIKAKGMTSGLPDPINTLTWLNQVIELEVETTDYQLKRVEESIQSRVFSKESLREAINFVNLCGDYAEQAEDEEIGNLRNQPNIRQLWEFYYREVFWKEYYNDNNAICLPQLSTEEEQLCSGLQSLIEVFLSRLDIYNP